MASVAVSTSPKVVAVADTRNLHWKSNNVGSKLLQKMGWVDGQAVGKRQRRNSSSNSISNNNNMKDNITTSTTETTTTTTTTKSIVRTISGEGLRITKRKDQLGLGAQSQSTAFAVASSNTQHVQDFASVLAKLQQDNQMKKNKKKNKKKGRRSPSVESSSITSLPTNKMTHMKVRNAKFQEKTHEDMKCIFAGGLHDFPKVMIEEVTTNKETKGKKRKNIDDNEEQQLSSTNEQQEEEKDTTKQNKKKKKSDDKKDKKKKDKKKKD